MSVEFNKSGVIKVDNIGINSNILLGTHTNNFTTNMATANDRDKGIMSAGSGGNGTFSITQEDDLPVGIYSYNVVGNTSGNRDFQQGGIPYEAGKQYVGSWWAKGSGTCLYRSWDRTKSGQPMSTTFTLTDDWKYYCHTFTATQAMEDDDCTFHLGVTGNSTIHICGMKLEEGSVPTPWCLNENEDGYLSNKHGFIEIGNTMKIYENIIQTNNFIEY